MKSLVAAALALCARSEDATSLMQGLMERHSKISSSDASSNEHRKDSTAKLMETASKMIKNGATPDVMQFINDTIITINVNVLGVITEEYFEDQNYIDAMLQRLQDAADAIPDPSVYVQQAQDRLAMSNLHKGFRADEAVWCAKCRKCEAELLILWERVKVAESEMRRIHDAIHGEWCLRDGFNPHPPTPDCWNWPLEGHFEGPETSQSVVEYCTTDVSSDIRGFRAFNVEYFGHYHTQITRVQDAWAAYNAKIVICSQCDTDLTAAIDLADNKQRDLNEAVCDDAVANRQHRKTFGSVWHNTLLEYREAVGDCRVCLPSEERFTSGPCEVRELCDPNAVPHDDNCKCTGILAEEQDRKREWESLHIVKCLLETVYTHVIHAIELDEPCVTTDSHPEQVDEEINICHIVEYSFTANLTHSFCVDRTLPYNMDGCLPEPPILPPWIEPPCTSEYIWMEQGFFPYDIQVDYRDRIAEAELGDYFTALSDKDWAGCAAPKVCLSCEAMDAPNPNPDYTQDSVNCKAHEVYLQPGQNNGESFRCLADAPSTEAYFPSASTSQCVPSYARCNGQSNCGDGSDELGCNTLWGVAADLRMASTEECRADATVVPGSFDDVQFFCASGECTSIEAKCNGVNNCLDGSDESNCPTTGTVGLMLEATSGFTVSTEATISTNTKVFHDRQYHFESVGSMTGLTHIKSSNDDKFTAHDHVQMKVRLPQPMTLYVAKIATDHLTWLDEVGPDGVTKLWSESLLNGVSYSGDGSSRMMTHGSSSWRQTMHREWIMGAPTDYQPGNNQMQTISGGGSGDVRHEDWAHHRGSMSSTGSFTYSAALDAGFLNGDAAIQRDGPVDDLSVTTVVYERTFPAGVVSMPGNGGGDGSYLLFAGPAHMTPTTTTTTTTLPGGGSMYIGCFVDDSDRDLGAMEAGGATYTFASCSLRCAGYAFLSLQYGGECFCANEYSTAAQYVQVADSLCNMVREPCTSSSHNCGGTWHQAIYQIGSVGEHQCDGMYEAEDARLHGAIVHANTASIGHQGFTGRSFADYLNANGDFIEWTVDSCSGGDATASFRYALGSGNRPLRVLVNDVEATASLSFPSTGGWNAWASASVAVHLSPGQNVIRLVAIGSSGANMDSLTTA